MGRNIEEGGENSFLPLITMVHEGGGKKRELLSIMRAWESEEELYYFRSQIPMVYSIKFDKEDLCADVFTYLQSGFEITYIHIYVPRNVVPAYGMRSRKIFRGVIGT